MSVNHVAEWLSWSGAICNSKQWFQPLKIGTANCLINSPGAMTSPLGDAIPGGGGTCLKRENDQDRVRKSKGCLYRRKCVYWGIYSILASKLESSTIPIFQTTFQISENSFDYSIWSKTPVWRLCMLKATTRAIFNLLHFMWMTSH